MEPLLSRSPTPCLSLKHDLTRNLCSRAHPPRAYLFSLFLPFPFPSPSRSVTKRTGELAKNLLGPPGSTVVLGMLRNKSELITIELKRQWPKAMDDRK
jgi:hypothetical protein